MIMNDKLIQYYDFVRENGPLVEEESLREIDYQIDTIIKHIEKDVLNNESRKRIVRSMIVLANLRNKRSNVLGEDFSKRPMVINQHLIDFLAMELDDDLTYVTSEDGKNITLYKDGEAVFGIRTFADDRFVNEELVSCSSLRGRNYRRGNFVVTKNYILGDNGIYINASDESFLSTFLDTGIENFPNNPEIKYNYIPYNHNEKRTYVDRNKGITREYSLKDGEVVCEEKRFFPPLLDSIICGSIKTDSELEKFVYEKK